MNIPRAVIEDPKIGLEAGQSVTVRAIIHNGDAYVKIEGVADE